MVTWFSLYVHMTWIPFCCREKWICSYSIWEILECLRIFAMTHARDWAGRTTRSTVLKENRNKKKFHTKMLCVCSVDFPEAAKHVQLHFFFLCGRRDSSPSNPPMFSTLHWSRHQSVGFWWPGAGRRATWQWQAATKQALPAGRLTISSDVSGDSSRQLRLHSSLHFQQTNTCQRSSII